jgi:hypothetical protein
MAGQQIEGLDFADRSRVTYRFQAGCYFEFYESCRRMAARVVRATSNVIWPPDQFFGSYATAAPLTANLRLAWVSITAGIALLAALLFLGWSEIGAGPVSSTEPRSEHSGAIAGPRVQTQADRMEAIRRRGLELLRADFPENEPSPSLARSDRLELHNAPTKPVIRIATAREDEASVAASALPPALPAASKSADAKNKDAMEESQAHRRYARASRHHRDRVRMAHAKYVQVASEPQVTSSSGKPPDWPPPQE